MDREPASKTEVRIIDLLDTGHPSLLRMWDKRQRGYGAMARWDDGTMGYREASDVPAQ